MTSSIDFNTTTDLFTFDEVKKDDIDVRSQTKWEEIKLERNLRNHFKKTHRPWNFHRIIRFCPKKNLSKFVPNLPTIFETHYSDGIEIICPTPLRSDKMPQIIITDYLN